MHRGMDVHPSAWFELGALAAGEADYTHFTWWSQATFTSYSVLGVLGMEIEVCAFPSHASNEAWDEFVCGLTRPLSAVLFHLRKSTAPNHSSGYLNVVDWM